MVELGSSFFFAFHWREIFCAVEGLEGRLLCANMRIFENVRIMVLRCAHGCVQYVGRLWQRTFKIKYYM